MGRKLEFLLSLKNTLRIESIILDLLRSSKQVRQEIPKEGLIILLMVAFIESTFYKVGHGFTMLSSYFFNYVQDELFSLKYIYQLFSLSSISICCIVKHNESDIHLRFRFYFFKHPCQIFVDSWLLVSLPFWSSLQSSGHLSHRIFFC